MRYECVVRHEVRPHEVLDLCRALLGICRNEHLKFAKQSEVGKRSIIHHARVGAGAGKFFDYIPRQSGECRRLFEYGGSPQISGAGRDVEHVAACRPEGRVPIEGRVR